MLLVSAALGIRQKFADAKSVVIEITVGGNRIVAEVANTGAKKEKGLGGRASLENGRGMYFPFDSVQYWVFWMKDMEFPIDAVWVRDGRVVDVTRGAMPPREGRPPQTFSPALPADAVLEIAAGEVDRLGLAAGDDVVIDSSH